MLWGAVKFPLLHHILSGSETLYYPLIISGHSLYSLWTAWYTSIMIQNAAKWKHILIFYYCYGENFFFQFNWNFPHESVRLKSRLLKNKPTNQITPRTSKPSAPSKNLNINCQTPQAHPGTSEIHAKKSKQKPFSVFSHHKKT